MSVDRCQSFQNSSLSSLPPAPVCHPSPSRPPARLLLQTQLRGHLDTLRKSHTGVSVSRDTCTLSSTHQPLASSSSLLPSLLQHHCSIPHHHSSSTHLQKLFFFFFFTSVEQLSLCFPMCYYFSGFSNEKQTCALKTLGLEFTIH